jgi:hypothetical protein
LAREALTAAWIVGAVHGWYGGLMRVMPVLIENWRRWWEPAVVIAVAVVLPRLARVLRRGLEHRWRSC